LARIKEKTPNIKNVDFGQKGFWPMLAKLFWPNQIFWPARVYFYYKYVIFNTLSGQILLSFWPE
jgi:hypothetical protein